MLEKRIWEHQAGIGVGGLREAVIRSLLYVGSARGMVDERSIDALNALSAQQLREEWRRLYRAQPPRLSRDLLVRSLAYRIQELASGGLNKATQRTLANLAREMAAKGAITVAVRSPTPARPEKVFRSAPRRTACSMHSRQTSAAAIPAALRP